MLERKLYGTKDEGKMAITMRPKYGLPVKLTAKIS